MKTYDEIIKKTALISSGDMYFVEVNLDADDPLSSYSWHIDSTKKTIGANLRRAIDGNSEVERWVTVGIVKTRDEAHLIILALKAIIAEKREHPKVDEFKKDVEIYYKQLNEYKK